RSGDRPVTKDTPPLRLQICAGACVVAGVSIDRAQFEHARERVSNARIPRAIITACVVSLRSGVVIGMTFVARADNEWTIGVSAADTPQTRLFSRGGIDLRGGFVRRRERNTSLEPRKV